MPREQPHGWASNRKPGLVTVIVSATLDQIQHIEATFLSAGLEILSRKAQSEGARLIQGRGDLRHTVTWDLIIPADQMPEDADREGPIGTTHLTLRLPADDQS